MNKTYVIREQGGLFLTKQGELTDGADPAVLFKSTLRDVALNSLIEFNARNIELRSEVLEVQTTNKGVPIVEVTASLPQPTETEEPPETEENCETSSLEQTEDG